MLADPVTIQLPPIYSHKHRWAILVDEKFSLEFPYDSEQEVFAVCTEPECGERMMKEQIERVLDEAQ